jgi:hypothetical protein
MIALIYPTLVLVACGGHEERSDSSAHAARAVRVESARAVARSPVAATFPIDTELGVDHPAWLDSLLIPGASFDVATIDTIARGVICYTYPKYVAVGREVEEVGSDIIVRRRASSPATAANACGADSVTGDFVIRNHDAEYFTGIAGHWLILDSGTGNVRTVIIYDVDSRKQLASFPGAIGGWRDSTTLLVWLGSGEGSRALCPSVAKELYVYVDDLMVLGLPSGQMRATGRRRCAASE